jgi:hypothetical protein
MKKLTCRFAEWLKRPSPKKSACQHLLHATLVSPLHRAASANLLQENRTAKDAARKPMTEIETLTAGYCHTAADKVSN